MIKKGIAVILFLFLVIAYPMLSEATKDKMKEIEVNVDKIIKAATKDSSSWERLAYICDTYGHRLSGSENLENAIQWILAEMKRDGLANVSTDEVMVPNWKRGNEYCELISPHKEIIPMLGIGGSASTPREGITAPVMVVKSFDELKSRAGEAKGKIVLFNAPYKNYGFNVAFRWAGAIQASQAGAAGSLIRSVTPQNANVAHTGSMADYPDTIRKTPHAAITPEWADILERMVTRGQNPVVKLFMESKYEPDAKTYNVMAELEGSEKKDEFIAFGGHLDSWDVGSGAHDDAGGCVAAWEALKLLKNLGIKPKRTLRAVMWANEENGQMGGKVYAKKHGKEKHALVLEMDSGVFPPSAIGFSATDSTLFKKVKEFEPILRKVDSITVRNGGGGVDISPMMKLGVPGIGLNTNDNGKYFWYHHAPTDTPDKVNPDDLNRCIAAIAVTVYLYSELIP